MSSNQIKFPVALQSNPHLFDKINTNNAKLYDHIDYLRELVTSMHQMYNQLCKRILQVSDQYERKLVAVSKMKTEHEDVILEFVRSISSLHYGISNQLNSNTVTLGIKTHRIAKNRLDVLRERVLVCKENNMEYSKAVQEFNSEEKQFSKECEYFSDYQKDVLKYFSLKSNLELHQKLQLREIKLKQKRQDIFHMKMQYQENVHQCRVLIGDYFDMQTGIIAQYSRLLLSVRKKSNSTSTQLYAQAIIQEPSNQMNTSTNKNDVPALTNRSERPLQKSVVSLRKDIIREEERIKIFEGLFEKYIQQYEKAIKVAGQKIDDIRDDTDYGKFINEKLAMVQILPSESIRQIDMIINEITLFRTIILNIQAIFGKIKVIQQIQKYRRYNYDKFIDETSHFSDMEKRNTLSLSTKAQYFKLESKFLDRNADLCAKYRQRAIELQHLITQQYYRQDVAYSENKNRKIVHNSIFVKAYYQTLADSFFLNKNNNSALIYKENPHLKKLSTHLSANQIQTSLTLNGFQKKMKTKVGMGGCCGLFVEEPTQEEDDKSSGSHSLIDDFHCSLKDGLVLIRGKLKLYENYISFSSSFNSKTLFGLSDIRIPKWNILRITLSKHLLSDKINVQTTHGQVEFTDFFNCPYQLMVLTYETKKSGVTMLNQKQQNNFHHNSGQQTQVAMLEQRFQSDFQGILMNAGIRVDKLSTYLSEDKQKLSISIEYHLVGSSNHSLFEIKIIQKQIAIEYVFIHDQKCRKPETKDLLQQASKDLINRKTKEQPPINTFKKIGRTSYMDCSIIQGQEKNKISFMKEPSFMNQKKDGNFGQNSNSSFAQFLNSKNFLQSSRILETQSKITPQISRRLTSSQDLQQQIAKLQKIRFSVDDSINESKEQYQKPHNKPSPSPKSIKVSGKSHKSQHVPITPKQMKSIKGSKKKKEGVQENDNKKSNFKVAIYLVIGVLILNILVSMFVPN